MIKANFMAAGMAGVVGAIERDAHKNNCAIKRCVIQIRKVHYINTQIAFDATFNILDVAKWPGSTHDPRILMESGLRRELSLQDVLTAYLSPQPGAQLKYNIAHKNTRNLVERGIGQMKRRFHVLHGEIRLSPERASILQ
ncbi:putative nuclease HARBI1 [Merluccius polli]|uniref:Nuclease HARBI1 n=1 Tax=Merluccius polli TaxID=89951 RepID=A0AA47P8B1_MERPO|nr:putative nuclease HARBI1 [Merluccius polli]